MPFRRRSFKRRSFKRRGFRRFRRRGVKRGLRQPVHYVKRLTGTVIDVAGAASTGASIVAFVKDGVIQLSAPNLVTSVTGTSYLTLTMAFAMDDFIASSTNFTNLYDQYSIRAVKLMVTNFNTGGDGNTDTVPTPKPGIIVHSALDFNDNLTLAASVAGLRTLQEYQTYRWWNVQDTGRSLFKRYLKPKVARTIYAGVTPGYEMPKGSVWLDVAQTDIPHYGVKLLFEIMNYSTVTVNIDLKVQCVYYMAFKNIK